MRTMHGALSAVARRFDVAQIVPDAEGFAEMVVEETLSVWLRVVDEYELELSARIPEFGDTVTPDLAEALLRCNGRLDGLRFALEPERGGVVLGRRVDVRLGPEADVPQAVAGFIASVADWRTSGAEALRHGALRRDAPFGAAGAGLRL